MYVIMGTTSDAGAWKKMLLVICSALSISFGSCQNKPIPDYSIYVLSLQNGVNRFYFQLSDKVFMDPQDGDIKKLKLDWLTSSGSLVDSTNWIQLHKQTRNLIGYLSPDVYDNYPMPDGYEYILKATNSYGISNTKIYRVKLLGPSPIQPYYVQSLTLQSSSPTLYTKNNVELLFAIQESKLFQYNKQNNQGVVDINTLTTISLKIAKANGITRIELKWSSNLFVSAQCPIQLINKFRTAIIKNNKMRYTSFFQPEFTVVAKGEYLQGECSRLSLQAPLTGNVQFSPVNVEFGKYFSVSIPSQLFLSPAGSDMEIKIELRNLNGVNVNENNWVQLVGSSLKSGVKLEGLASYNTAAKRISYSFQLTAITPFLMDSSFNININILNFQKTEITWLAIFQSISTNIIQTTWLKTFLFQISNFLRITSSSIMVIDFQKQIENKYDLRWTFKSTVSCDQMNSFTNQLMINNGPSTQLMNIMNQINFPLSSFKIENNQDCSKIIVNKPLGVLPFRYQTFFNYIIPPDAYTDASGSILKYSIVNDPMLTSSWLTVDSRRLYGIPIAKQLKATNEFVLKVQGDESDIIDRFYIEVNSTQPPNIYFYTIRFEYSREYNSIADVLYTFVNKLIDYFGDIDKNQIIVNDVISTSSTNILSVVYYNSTFYKLNTCNKRSHVRANLKLFDGKFPNPQLEKFLQPQFKVLEISSKKVSSCTANLSPIVNIAYFISNQSPTGPFTIKWGWYTSKTVPVDLFRDEEDGNTRNLKLTLTTKQNTQLAVDSWISFNQATQTLYAVPSDLTYINKITTYILTASDSAGDSVSIEYIFQPTSWVASNSYSVTFYLNIFSISSYTYSQQLFEILPHLETLLTKETFQYNICVKKYRMLTKSTAELVWVPCALNQFICDFTQILNLRNLFYETDTRSVKSSMKVKFPIFQLTNIIDVATDKCMFTPPTIIKPIPPISATYCGLNRFIIPENTFYDQEDGGTRNLMLSVKKLNSENNLDDWLYFDIQKQQIEILLTSDFRTGGTSQTVFTYILEAMDRSLLKITQAFTINIIDSPVQIDYKIFLQAQFISANNNNDIPPFIFLAQRLGDYFKDDSKGFEAISKKSLSNGILLFEFGNCTIPFSSCNNIEQQKYKNMIKNEDKSFKESFKTILIPEFQSSILSDTSLTECVTDTPPQLINKLSPIYVNIQETVIIEIPSNTFYDLEDGSTRDLRLELFHINNEILTSNFWVSFNKDVQTITIVATKTIADGLQLSKVSLTLEAYDSKQQKASQVVDIIINYPKQITSHYFRMQFIITDTILKNSNFVFLYKKLRGDILNYFKDRSSNIRYHSASDDLTSVLTVEWSNSSISDVTCEQDKIKYMETRVLTQNDIKFEFRNHLSSFVLTELKLYYDGICKDRPEVKNPIPILKVSLCSNLNYQIPENTFDDRINGNTRKLKLNLLTNKGLPVNKDSYVFLDAVSQKILFVPFDKMIQGSVLPFTQTYLIKATSSRGSYVVTSLTVKVDDNALPYSFYYQLTANWLYDDQIKTTAQVLYEVQRKTNLYFSYTNNIRVLDFQKTSAKKFKITLTVCSLVYSPCDTININTISTKILNPNQNQYNNFYRSFLLPKIDTLSVVVFKSGPCKVENNPPVQYLPIPDKTLNACSTFKYKLNPQTFNDQEDGYNLNHVIIKVNDQLINFLNTWIYLRPNKVILATVNNDVILVGNKYKITVRAFDSEQLYVDANWNIGINGNKAQDNYIITLYLTSLAPLEDLWIEKYYLSSYINNYFNANTTNGIQVNPLGGNRLQYRWSSCNLPLFCNNSAASILLLKMKQNNQVNVGFKNAFSQRYVLNDVSMTINSRCQTSLTPPVPINPTWVVDVNQCGGLDVLIPENLFLDAQDGNTRKLSLTLEISGGMVTWMYLDTQNQRLYIHPTRDEAVKYTSFRKTTFTLKATDKSGLSAYIAVNIKMQISAPSRYKFRFKYIKVVNVFNKVRETLLFAMKISKYIGKPITSIGLQSITSPTDSSINEFVYSDCSISYNPCDIASLTVLKNQFIDDITDVTKQNFKLSMLPEFEIILSSVKAEYPCTNFVPSPPVIINTITVLKIPLCGYFTYRIPDNTFYDNQDGSTRNLKLHLKTSAGTAIESSHWLQFNREQQTIYALPMVNMQISNSYILTATDSSDLTSSMILTTAVEEGSEFLKQCQLRTDFTTSVVNKNIVQMVYDVTEKIRKYFNLKNVNDIALIEYSQTSQTGFQLYWSFCSVLYRQKPSALFDAYGFIVNVLMKLYNKGDGTTLNPTFYNAFGSEYTVVYVARQFTGKCTNLSPIVRPGKPPISISSSSCGYTQYLLSNELFYDFEQGGLTNLNLELYEEQTKLPLPLNSWVNLDIRSQSIIVICYDETRKVVPTVLNYILQATDNNNQAAIIKVTVSKCRQLSNTLTPFDVTFLLEYKGLKSRPLVQQTIYLSQRIKSFYQINPADDLLIKLYKISPGLPEYRAFTWTTCALQTCNSDVLSKTKQLQSNGPLSEPIVNSFGSDFVIKRVYYTSTLCSTTLYPPFTNDQPIPINPLPSCSLFTYRLTEDVFIDTVDGRTSNLNIKFVDANNIPVDRTSLIQFNPSNLHLYAINVQSFVSKTSKIKGRFIAYNSGLLPAVKEINVMFDNSTYITTKCALHVIFRYKYMTSDTVHLDVLWKFVNGLNNYYQDMVEQVKVLDFQLVTNNIFQIKWSNCSLVNANTDELQQNEAVRIYSRVVHMTTKEVVESFKVAMSDYFVINSAIMDEQCSDKKPRAKYNTTIEISVSSCEEFMYVLPNDLFLDEKDGDIRNMEITLAYRNGKQINNKDWVRVDTSDKNKQYIYGTVTQQVISNQPKNNYKYLIVCTDKSGKKSTINIRITVIQQLYDNEFIIGFEDKLIYSMLYSKSLHTLRSSVSEYLDRYLTGVGISVKTYVQDSYLQFSLCYVSCNIQAWDNIISRFQNVKYMASPAQSLINALRQHADVNYVFISTPRCLPITNNPPIIPQECLDDIYVPINGCFNYTVPSNCFIDGQGRSARDFLLRSNSPELRWIQFDIPKQRFYGIQISNEVPSSDLSLDVTSQHPQSGIVATKKFSVKFKERDILRSSGNQVCKITIEMINKILQKKKDVTLLKMILERLSSFVNIKPDCNSYVVDKFEVSGDVILLTYTNYTWLRILQNDLKALYLKEVAAYLNNYFILSNNQVVNIKSVYKSYFQPEFVFKSIQVSPGCIDTSTSTPTPGEDLIINLKNNCGKFSFQLPQNIFIDSKYGNARNLELSLLSEFADWISLSEKMTIFGLIDQNIYLNQPISGYKMKLKATNPDGNSATLYLFIKIPIQNWSVEFSSINIRLVMTPLNTPRDILEHKISVLDAVKNSKYFKNLNNHFYFIDYSIQNGASITSTKIAYCDQCATDFYLMASTIKSLANEFKTELNKKLSVFDILFLMPTQEAFSQKCYTVISPTRKPIKVNFKYCRNNVFYLTDYYGININKYNVMSLTSGNNNVPYNSWVNLLRSPYRFVGYPKQTDKIIQSYYLFNVNVSNGQVKLPTMQFLMHIKNDFSIETNRQKFYLIFDTETISSDVFYINSIWNAIQKSLNMYKMQHIKLTYISNVYERRRIWLSWYFCDMPTQCDNNATQYINSMVYNNENGKINEELKAKLRFFDLKSFSSSCKNSVPIATNKFVIEIPQCGYFEYRIPNHFAFDIEDGYLNQMEVRLKNADGTDLNVASWIQIDNNLKTINAFPTQQVLSEPIHSYYLYVTDNQGESTKILLNINIVNKTTSYFEQSITFRSIHNRNYLAVQKDFITLMVQFMNFTKIEDYFVVSYTKTMTKDVFVLTLRNCLIKRKICLSKDSQIKRVSRLLAVANGQVTEQFQNFVYEKTNKLILPLFISNEAKYGIYTEPQVSTFVIPDIKVSYCNPVKYKIPYDLFTVDKIDGKLTYHLTTLNNEILPESYWAGIYDNCIYVSPLVNIQKAKYRFKLVAKDNCGRKVFTYVNINILDNPIETRYSMKFYLNAVEKNSPLSYLTYILVRETMRCYEDPQSYFQVNSIQKSEDLFEFEITSCSFQAQPCDLKVIEKIQAKIFSNISNSIKFKQCFQQVEMKNIKENNCQNVNSTMPIVNIYPKFTLKYCSNFSKQIDLNTFYDYEDGSTRNLYLELLMGDSTPISKNNFIQFNKETQSVYGYPRSLMMPQNETMTYKLTATDTSGKIAVTDVTFLVGSKRPVINYAVTLSIKKTEAITKKPIVDSEIKLFELLENYFKEKLNNINFQQTVQFIQIQFSFCELTSTESCDCDKIKTYRDLIYPIRKLQSYLEKHFQVTSVKESHYNICSTEANLPRAHVVNESMNHLDFITVGTLNTALVRHDEFHDEQEGNTHNLYLNIETITKTQLPIDYWLTINQNGNQTKVCSLMTLREFNRWLLLNDYGAKYQKPGGIIGFYQYEYYIVAKDSCGFKAYDYQNSTIQHFDFQETLTFKFNLILTVNKNELVSNCTLMETLVKKITSYKNNKKNIFIEEVVDYNESLSRTAVRWGYPELSNKNCDNNTIFNTQQIFLTKDNQNVDPNFVEYMKPEFIVESLANTTEQCVAFREADEFTFPWWIMWLLLALALLLLLLWLMWLCCPRYCCCKGCCCCGIFKKCCTPAGKYSSFDDKGDHVDGDVESNFDDDDSMVNAKPLDNGGTPAMLPKPMISDENPPAALPTPQEGEENRPIALPRPQEGEENRPIALPRPQEGDEVQAAVLSKQLPKPRTQPSNLMLAYAKDDMEVVDGMEAKNNNERPVAARKEAVVTSPMSNMSNNLMMSSGQSESNNFMPSQRRGSASNNFMTSEQRGSASNNFMTSEQRGSASNNIMPSQRRGSASNNFMTSEQRGLIRNNLLTSQQRGSESSNFMASQQRGSESKNFMALQQRRDENRALNKNHLRGGSLPQPYTFTSNQKDNGGISVESYQDDRLNFLRSNMRSNENINKSQTHERNINTQRVYNSHYANDSYDTSPRRTQNSIGKNINTSYTHERNINTQGVYNSHYANDSYDALPRPDFNTSFNSYRYVDALIDTPIRYKHDKKQKSHKRLKSESEAVYRRKNMFPDTSDSVLFTNERSPKNKVHILRKSFKRKNKEPVVLTIEDSQPRKNQRKRYKRFENNIDGDFSNAFYEDSSVYYHKGGRNQIIGNRNHAVKEVKILKEKPASYQDSNGESSENFYFSPRILGRKLYSRDKQRNNIGMSMHQHIPENMHYTENSKRTKNAQQTKKLHAHGNSRTSRKSHKIETSHTTRHSHAIGNSHTTGHSHAIGNSHTIGHSRVRGISNRDIASRNADMQFEKSINISNNFHRKTRNSNDGIYDQFNRLQQEHEPINKFYNGGKKYRTRGRKYVVTSDYEDSVV